MMYANRLFQAVQASREIDDRYAKTLEEQKQKEALLDEKFRSKVVAHSVAINSASHERNLAVSDLNGILKQVVGGS